jgi:ABC-type transporter lipoprotein component MlaA
MTFRRFSLYLLAATLLSGCATDDEPRMRAGIQDPIERHPRRTWHLPTLLPDDISVIASHENDYAG